MKNSEIEWIGEIPDDWEVIPNKFLMSREKNICSQYNGETILSLTMKGVIERDLDAGGKMPSSFDGYQIIKAGNLLLCLFDIDVTPRCAGLIMSDGITSPAYSQFVMKEKAYAPYYNYYYIMVDDTKELLHMAKNLRHSLTESQFGMINAPVPPLSNQKSIVNFLDKKCAAVDKLIANQQGQIEKLKEYKQAIITEAVTKGLNPSAPMKASGVEWIGNIPEGWSTSRVGLLYKIVLGKMLCQNKISADYTLEKYYCAANVHFDGISSSNDLKEMWFSKLEKELYKVNNGDLLIVEGGAGAGGCSIVYNITENIFVQNSVMIVRSGKISDTRYLKYLIESLVKRGYIDVVCNKATIPHFTKDKLSNTPCAVPPIQEQQQIADYLDKKCEQIDKLISIKQAKIEKLNEYKKSLIYEYVTGKKEVG